MIGNLQANNSTGNGLKEPLKSRLIYTAAALAWSLFCLVLMYALPAKLWDGNEASLGWRLTASFLFSSVVVGLIFRRLIRSARGLEFILSAVLITAVNAWIFCCLMLPFDSGYVGGPWMIIPSGLAIVAVGALFAPLAALSVGFLGIVSMFVMRSADRFSRKWGGYA